MIKSSLPGIKYGAPHYKHLGQDKTNAFKIPTGCFTAMMILSPQSLTDIQWWYNKINRFKNNITKGELVFKISSDESSFGWGAVWNNIRTGGTFNLKKTMKRKRRAMMQMQNHAKNKLNWNGCLTKKCLTKIISKFQFQSKMDLFASRLNAQLPVFVSYQPDPEAKQFIAFAILWRDIRFYAFPPFAAIEKMLYKIVLDVATGIIVVPNWSIQPWFSLLMMLLKDIPIVAKSSFGILQRANHTL